MNALKPSSISLKIVNNTSARIDLEPFRSAFDAAYESGELPAELSDLFSIEFLKSYNADGTDRMIVNIN